MAVEIKAPNSLISDGVSVFLAGSIEMGTAQEWQQKVVDSLVDTTITIFNPRRDDWDSSWEQTIENKEFNEQVTWELKGLEQADIVAVYFDPDTKSPVTMLELGLYARSGKLVVCCPQGFNRKGNIDIVCQRYGIEQVESLDELVASIKDRAKRSISEE
jgi:nucleoside 2-deoxyribosyltransferase